MTGPIGFSALHSGWLRLEPTSGSSRVLRVKDSPNGQLKFDLNVAPYVIYDCYLSGSDKDHVLTLAPRGDKYPGGS